MQRIDNATSNPAPPPYPAQAPGQHFTSGDPATNTPATIVDAWWTDQVQEEICAVIEAAGIVLAKGTNNQLLQALGKFGRMDSVQVITGATHTFVASDGGSKMVMRSNGNAGWMRDLLPGSGAFLPQGWQATILNGEISGSSYLYNIRAAAGATLNGAAATVVTLGPGQEARIFSDGAGNYYTASMPSRVRLGGTVTFNVATGGSNAGGDGSPTAPFADPYYASGWLSNFADLAGNSAIVKVADGTYNTSGTQLNGKLVGQTTATAGLQFIGNTANPGNCLLESGSNGAFLAQNGAAFSVSGFQMHATGVGLTLVVAFSGSRVDVGHCNFGQVTGNSEHITGQFGGSLIVGLDCAILGGGLNFCASTNNGTVLIGSGVTLTLSGTPFFSGAFASADTCGTTVISGVNFAGSGATGARYSASTNGVVHTNGGGPNYLPGNAAGIANTGLYT